MKARQTVGEELQHYREQAQRRDMDSRDLREARQWLAAFKARELREAWSKRPLLCRLGIHQPSGICPVFWDGLGCICLRCGFEWSPVGYY